MLTTDIILVGRLVLYCTSIVRYQGTQGTTIQGRVVANTLRVAHMSRVASLAAREKAFLRRHAIPFATPRQQLRRLQEQFVTIYEKKKVRTVHAGPVDTMGKGTNLANPTYYSTNTKRKKKGGETRRKDNSLRNASSVAWCPPSRSCGPLWLATFAVASASTSCAASPLLDSHHGQG